MADIINQTVSLINDKFLGYILMSALMAAGIYFSFATRLVQFISPKKMLNVMKTGIKSGEGKGHISSFQAFSISTASRVGTGNIAGIAIAITVGGPGAIFWMWLIAVISAASAFVESTLAQVYKVKQGKHFRGGPAYYMQTALGKRWLGCIFAVIITLTFAFVFNSVQSNTIAQSLYKSFNISPLASGIIIAALTAIIIFGGLKRIASFSAVIVPFFALSYIAITLIAMILNIDKMPDVLALIFKDAFSLRNIAGGTLGATIMTGARRGLFSNEAGMGSAPNAAATANIAHPVTQGYVQALSVFVDTLIICSCTAFIVLLSDYANLNLEGIALTQAALSQTMGSFGEYFISASVLLFAFTSIIGNYYYGQANIEFLTDKKWIMPLFRILVTAMVLLGAVAQLHLVWNMADLFMTIMALMNISVLFLLRKQALDVLADYRRQRKAGVQEPIFDPANVPSVQKAYAWQKHQ